MTTDDAVRSRLALAFDVDDLVAAVRLARRMRRWFGTAKVGLELYSAAGPDAVGALAELGYDVFLDLKLHDIPTTVERASRVLGALGPRYLNFHTQGGPAMLRAGVDGFKGGAEDAGLPEPVALAVTILTSAAEAPLDVLEGRVADALDSGCDGVVCAAGDLRTVKQLAPRLTTVVPGIRLAGGPRHDQGRTATPAEALEAGADLLVIGRAVTAAEDPEATAEAIAAGLL